MDALASRIKEQLGDVELDKSIEALVEDAIAASGVNANDDRAVAALLENSSDKVMADVMVKGRAAQVAQFVSELKGLDAEALSAILAQM